MKAKIMYLSLLVILTPYIYCCLAEFLTAVIIPIIIRPTAVPKIMQTATNISNIAPPGPVSGTSPSKSIMWLLTR